MHRELISECILCNLSALYMQFFLNVMNYFGRILCYHRDKYLKFLPYKNNTETHCSVKQKQHHVCTTAFNQRPYEQFSTDRYEKLQYCPYKGSEIDNCSIHATYSLAHISVPPNLMNKLEISGIAPCNVCLDYHYYFHFSLFLGRIRSRMKERIRTGGGMWSWLMKQNSRKVIFLFVHIA